MKKKPLIKDIQGRVFGIHRSTLLIVAVLGLCGCATVGPQSITAGRGVYAEVINRTEDEQILNVLVRLAQAGTG